MNDSTSSNQTSSGSNQPKSLIWKDYILISLHSLIFLVGTTGNFLVCKYFTLETKTLSQIRRWIIYLAVTDFLTSILDPAIFITLILKANKTDYGGVVGCKLIGPTEKVLKTISFSIVMIINIDRCISISRPYRSKLNSWKSNLILVAVLFISVTSNIQYFLRRYIDKNGICTDKEDQKYLLPVVFTYSARDVIFLLIFVATILTVRHELVTKDTYSDIVSISSKHERCRENHKVLRSLVTVSAAFIILVFPRDIFHIIAEASLALNPGDGFKPTDTLLDINSLLKFIQSINSVCNVFIYAKIHRRFRRLLRKSFQNTFPGRKTGIQRFKKERMPTMKMVSFEGQNGSQNGVKSYPARTLTTR